MIFYDVGRQKYASNYTHLSIASAMPSVAKPFSTPCLHVFCSLTWMATLQYISIFFFAFPHFLIHLTTLHTYPNQPLCSFTHPDTPFLHPTPLYAQCHFHNKHLPQSHPSFTLSRNRPAANSVQHGRDGDGSAALLIALHLYSQCVGQALHGGCSVCVGCVCVGGVSIVSCVYIY